MSSSSCPGGSSLRGEEVCCGSRQELEDEFPQKSLSSRKCSREEEDSPLGDSAVNKSASCFRLLILLCLFSRGPVTEARRGWRGWCPATNCRACDWDISILSPHVDLRVSIFSNVSIIQLQETANSRSHSHIYDLTALARSKPFILIRN